MLDENFALRSLYMYIICSNSLMRTSHVEPFSTYSRKQSVVKLVQRALTNQSQHPIFFDQSGAKSKLITTWLTCIFPRLTQFAFFSSSFYCHCAGSYRSYGIGYIKKVSLFSSACKNVIPLRFEILPNKRENIYIA